MEALRTLVYSFVCGDLLHWGHVLHLKKARALGDVLIVGVLGDDVITAYKRRPITSFGNRLKLVSQLKCVDLAIPQLFSRYPLNNLQLLHRLFPNDELICVHADDWKRGEFEAEIEFLKFIYEKDFQGPIVFELSFKQAKKSIEFIKKQIPEIEINAII